MKVAFFMRRPRPGISFSVELLFREIISHLDPEFEPVITVSRFTSNGVFRRAYNIFEAALRQQDVNHVTGDVHFLTYLLRRKKTVLTVLDCGRIDGEQNLSTHIIRLLWFTIPARRCSVITVISHSVKEQLLRHVKVDPNKIHVVPVPVPSIYSHVPKAFNEAKPTLLQIGGAPNKNRARLFEAIAGMSCRLFIVGPLSAIDVATLRRLDIEYENFIGIPKEQMLQLYSDCDIVAFPSTSEGFGMPIIEGNLVGRVVVTGNVTSMPEVAGDAACLVNPFDVTSIRSGIEKVVKDRAYREQLIENGFSNAKRYETSSITRRYEEIYRMVAGGEN